jgi:hypothetical protein
MKTYVTHFQIMMEHDAYLVALGSEDDYGLYSKRGTRNDFGTPLLARGTWAELTTFAPEAKELSR